jgi:hypothetical protein
MNEIYLDSEYDYEIDGVIIKNKVFNEELFDYRIEDRNDLIDNLIGWISESTKENDKALMKDDLRYLMRLTDEYVLSSIKTNEFIAKSDNEKEFNDLCFDLLKLNKEVQK